jgi:hypothetical protein
MFCRESSARTYFFVPRSEPCRAFGDFLPSLLWHPWQQLRRALSLPQRWRRWRLLAGLAAADPSLGGCGGDVFRESFSRSNFSIDSHSGLSSRPLVELIQHAAITFDEVQMSLPVVCSSSRSSELIDHRTPLGETLLIQLFA